MVMSRFKYVRVDGTRYEVFLRAPLTLLGVIDKRSEHYNLRRPVTIHWWQASSGNRMIKDGGGQVTARFDTREQAAEALLDKKRVAGSSAGQVEEPHARG